MFRSNDGGKTWEKALYINEKTGCADLLIDPVNPDIMYATTWEFRRTPYSFNSGGPGSAIYKSTDGGKNWRKLNKGLPEGDFGRVAIALAPSAPQNLLAIVESASTGLYISSDGGENWKQQSSSWNVCGRPFYFSTLVVDPTDPKRVYSPAYTFSISTDGGYSFTEPQYFGGRVHPDHHALWINPQNTSQLFLGTDGGVYISNDKGNSWNFLRNLPVGQFYHVAVDNQFPYNIYGGLQDNGSWRGPSRKSGGIKNGDWEDLYGGDGFWVQPDDTNSDIVYAFLTAMQLAAGTDYLLTVSERVASAFGPTFGLRLLAPPVELRPYALSLLWHARFDGDEAHEFLRGVFVRAANEAAGVRHQGARTRLDMTDPTSGQTRKRPRKPR